MAEVNSLILPSSGPLAKPVHSPSLSLVVAVYTFRAILMTAGVGQLSYVSAAAQYDALSARVTRKRFLIVGFIPPFCNGSGLNYLSIWQCI
ncbi:hypothetical protein [Paraburkholderia sp. BR14312]|uniref:hypothetical protein n=1 Tax=unclassified Paraburkholderia TaxID=2615204 RepID=UPI0034CEABCC